MEKEENEYMRFEISIEKHNEYRETKGIKKTYIDREREIDEIELDR